MIDKVLGQVVDSSVATMVVGDFAYSHVSTM